MHQNRFLYYSLAFITACHTLSALPQVNEVASGSAQADGGGSKHLKISTSDKAIINYESFNIGIDEQVTFVQPKANSAVLNRVKGSDASSLLGRLNANGRVFLINPNGIVIGPSGSINTGSFIASTLDIADSDFTNDRFLFSVNGDSKTASIVNQGKISSPEGAVALLALNVRNEGVIAAKAGKVVLAGGDKVTLDFSGDGLMSFSVDGDVKLATIEHLGTIEAPGGQVFIKMKVADNALKNIVNRDGVEEAINIVEENGVIRLVSKSYIAADAIHIDGAGKTQIDVQGSLNASRIAKGETGGSVQIFGDAINVQGADIAAIGDVGGGTVLIGGDYQGTGDMQKARSLAMDANSVIRADALTEGDGGKVILWSDGRTLFDGKIFAQGGQVSGNGGLTETSGKEGLGMATGHVNTLAAYGKAGNWLMDPYSINVVSGGTGTLAQAADCSDTSTVLTIDPSVINGAASNVTLCASSGITFSNDISMTYPNIGIFCEAPIGADVPITLSTANIATRGGALVFNGAVTLTTDVTVDTTFASNYNGAPVTFGSTIDASAVGAQGLTVYSGSAGAVDVAGNIGGSVPLGALTITGTSSGNGNAGIEVANISTAAGSESGNIVLNSAAGIYITDVAYTSAPSGGTSGTITISGDMMLNGGTSTFTTTNAAMTINGDINAYPGTVTNGIVANTNNGNFILNGDAGTTNNAGVGNTRLAAITVNAGTGTVGLGSVGDVKPGAATMSLTGSAITLNGGAYFTNGAQTYTGNTLLAFGTPATDGQAGISISTGNTGVTFTGNIDAVTAQATGLSIDGGTGGIVTIGGNVGSTIAPTYLNLGIIGGSNNNIILKGTTYTTRDSQYYNSGNGATVILSPGAAGTTTFTSSSGLVRFASQLNTTVANQNVTVSAANGEAFVGGIIGNAGTGLAAVGSVSVTGNTGITLSGIGTSAQPITGTLSATSVGGMRLAGTVYNSNGMQTYTGDVSLNTASMAFSTNTADAGFRITGAVDSAAIAARNLTVTTNNGAITIGGSMGVKNALLAVNLNAGSGAIAIGAVGNAAVGATNGLTLTSSTGITLNGGTYNISGAQSYAGNVVLGTTTSLLANNNITFSGMVDGVSSGIQGLTIRFSGANTVNFGGNVGSNNPLSDLAVYTGSDILNGSTPATLAVANTMVLDALTGGVGTSSSPINVSAPGGIVVIGATGTAWISGTTGDGTVHCLPNNPPSTLTFNGNVVSCP